MPMGEAARILAAEVFKRVNPVLAHLIAEAEREGHDEFEIYLAVASAALVIAASAHLGSDELFLKMAKSALARECEDEPAVH